jgi:hypothetical protein
MRARPDLFKAVFSNEAILVLQVLDGEEAGSH